MKFLLLIIFILTASLGENLKRKNLSKVVIDTKNKLMWIDDATVIKNKLTHKEAPAYCEQLSFIGYNNWRLPTIEEYKTIVDKNNYKNYINKAFKYNLKDGYWASKAHWRTMWFYADYMNFISGTAYFDNRDKKKYIRCVRDIK